MSYEDNAKHRRRLVLSYINSAMQGWMDFGQHLLFYADKAWGAGGLLCVMR